MAGTAEQRARNALMGPILIPQKQEKQPENTTSSIGFLAQGGRHWNNTEKPQGSDKPE
jgi:hypothetical protein